jgi:hypothetical protein
MFSVYNEMIPLNDNFEIENDDSLTFFECIFKVRDFFKECLKYLSYLYKIYEYFKKVLYYIYCFFSLLFFALCCYLTILFLGFMCRGAKKLFLFMVSYVQHKRAQASNQPPLVVNQPILNENRSHGKKNKYELT